MISWMCRSIDFIFLLYNSEILGWCKTEESVYFGVCCSASNVYSHSLWESTPTMHCMDLMHHVSYSLWADGEKKKSAYKFWLWFFWLIWNFPDVDVFLLFHVRLVVNEARHAFHHVYITNIKKTLHFRCWGLLSCKYGILMCKQMNCLEGEFIFMKTVKGPRRWG